MPITIAGKSIPTEWVMIGGAGLLGLVFFITGKKTEEEPDISAPSTELLAAEIAQRFSAFEEGMREFIESTLGETQGDTPITPPGVTEDEVVYPSGETSEGKPISGPLPAIPVDTGISAGPGVIQPIYDPAGYAAPLRGLGPRPPAPTYGPPSAAPRTPTPAPITPFTPVPKTATDGGTTVALGTPTKKPSTPAVYYPTPLPSVQAPQPVITVGKVAPGVKPVKTQEPGPPAPVYYPPVQPRDVIQTISRPGKVGVSEPGPVYTPSPPKPAPKQPVVGMGDLRKVEAQQQKPKPKTTPKPSAAPKPQPAKPVGMGDLRKVEAEQKAKPKAPSKPAPKPKSKPKQMQKGGIPIELIGLDIDRLAGY